MSKRTRPEKRPDEDPRAVERTPLVRALTGVNRLYARAFHRVRIDAPCRVPRDGPAILICNHAAGIDPVLLQATCPRFITWMMAREYYDLWPLRRTCERLGYVPVSRGGRDAASLKAALRALGAGKLLGVFPEGRIERTHDLLPLQSGVAIMALRTETPIYPAYLAGITRDMSMVQCFADPQQAAIRYGDPIEPRGDAESLTARMADALNRLKSHYVRRTPAPAVMPDA